MDVNVIEPFYTIRRSLTSFDMTFPLRLRPAHGDWTDDLTVPTWLCRRHQALEAGRWGQMSARPVC